MPKPVTIPVVWASDATFSSGPAAGQPVRDGLAGAAGQGMVPGVSIKAEPHNAVIGQNSEWASWLAEGTSSPDATAHVVETDAAGLAGLYLLAVTYTGADTDVSAIQASHSGGGAGISAAITATYTNPVATGAAIRASADDGAAAAFLALGQPNVPGFRMGTEAVDAGDFQLFPRATDPSNPATGSLWLANNPAATADYADALRWQDDTTLGELNYVHSSPVPHWYARDSRNSSDPLLTKTISSYSALATVSVQGRGNDDITIKAKVSLSANVSADAQIRIVANGIEVDVRTIDFGAGYVLSGNGEDYDFFLTAIVNESVFVGSGSYNVELQWRNPPATGTVYCQRAELEVIRGFRETI